MTSSTSTASSTSNPANPPHPHSHFSDVPLYRISTIFHSRPDLTEDQFYNHWYGTHGPLCVPWALHYGILEYTQYHTPTRLREALSQGKDGDFKGSSPFEACADFYVKDYKDYLAAFKDPYYLEVINKDEDLFVDKGQVEGKGERVALRGVMAISAMGVCRSIIREGKAVVDVSEDIWRRWEEYQGRKN